MTIEINEDEYIDFTRKPILKCNICDEYIDNNLFITIHESQEFLCPDCFSLSDIELSFIKKYYQNCINKLDVDELIEMEKEYRADILKELSDKYIKFIDLSLREDLKDTLRNKSWTASELLEMGEKYRIEKAKEYRAKKMRLTYACLTGDKYYRFTDEDGGYYITDYIDDGFTLEAGEN